MPITYPVALSKQGQWTLGEKTGMGNRRHRVMLPV
jgi:hypothetical protein